MSLWGTGSAWEWDMPGFSGWQDLWSHPQVVFCFEQIVLILYMMASTQLTACKLRTVWNMPFSATWSGPQLTGVWE